MMQFLSEIGAYIFGAGGLLSMLLYYGQTKRIKNADAHSIEINNKNLLEERYEKRLQDRDEKVDSLYKALREAQEQQIELYKQINEAKLTIKLQELQKCETRGCSERNPPGTY